MYLKTFEIFWETGKLNFPSDETRIQSVRILIFIAG